MSRKNAPVAPKAARGRLKEIRVEFGMFENAILCIVGPRADVAVYVEWKHERPVAPFWSETPSLGSTFYRHGYKPIVWVPRRPRTPRELGTLAHELLHAIRWLMQEWASIDFTNETQEVYCHALGFCMAEVLTKLGAR